MKDNPESSADDQAIAEEATRKSGSSFYLAMRLLPPEKRDAMYAVYAFCREVDDIADEPGDLGEKKVALTRWRGWIDELYAGGNPPHPVARALKDPISEYGLRREDFIAVIEGMEMDAEPVIRIRDMDELLLYCDRVACAVGRLSVRVFGMAEDEGIRLAKAEGLALQLTNILRDVADDADIGRIYLPADKLEAAGVPVVDAHAMMASPAIAGVCADVATEARARITEAEEILARSNRKVTRPARMMLAVYGDIFRRLERRGWRPDKLRKPVGPGKFGKLLIALKSGFL
jgi:phytoene synthase